MKQILFIILLAIGITSCVQTSNPDSTELAGIKKGDKYWILGICKGPEAGEVYAQSVEKSQNASPELIKLLRKGTCARLPQREVVQVERVVRALIDWENDEGYLVQIAHVKTNEPLDLYTIIWPQITNFEEQSNGSHNKPHTHNRLFSGPQWDISSHLTPVKAGETVWVGGMCNLEAALDLFLSAQTDLRDELQVHVQADRCRNLRSLQRVLIAAVITDGIDTRGNSYWLIQLANLKKEPQPWYSLAWECTLEVNLQSTGGDCR